MKKIFAIIFTGVSVMSLASCVTSLQPLVTYDKIITDQRLQGNWVHEETIFTVELLPKSKLANDVKESFGNSDKPFAFTGDPAKDSVLFNRMYIVSFEKKGVSYHIAASLIKLGGHLFMDIYPAIMHDPAVDEDEADPFDFSNDYLPGFTMAKVTVNTNGLTLSFADGSFIRDQIKAGKIKLKHESDELFDSFMITADTKELQLFMEKYANDERIFGKETTITLTRQPAHS